MAPSNNNSKDKGKEPAQAQIKLNLKAPEKGDGEASEETEPKVPKTSDEEFLLTLLDTVKVDHNAAANTLGINKAASRMRLIRLQQKYGFKKRGPKGTPRKKGTSVINKEAATENGLTAANDAEAVEEDTNVEDGETNEKKVAENCGTHRDL